MFRRRASPVNKRRVPSVSSPQERAAKSFVERHGLWTDEQFEAAAKAEKWIEERALEVVRLSFADKTAIFPAKPEVRTESPPMIRMACPLTQTPLAKTTPPKPAFRVSTRACNRTMPPGPAKPPT